MTSSDHVQAKARRYLAEGRLIVTHVSPDAIAGTCRGAGAVYVVGWHGRWECSCPARSDRCAHLVALRLVTTADPGRLTRRAPADGRSGPNTAEDGQSHPLSPAETLPAPDRRSGAHRSGVTR